MSIKHIHYVKKNGETSNRDIVPSFVPSPNMKALDVSSLSEEDKQMVSDLMDEYQEYRKLSMENIFNFGDWIDHTSKTVPQLKWRSFIMEHTTFQ
jgi:delta-aminolevulinic acid dehydratase/porphobilinogen synthase